MADESKPEPLSDDDLAKAQGAGDAAQVDGKGDPIVRDDPFASDGGLGTTRRSKTGKPNVTEGGSSGI
jgi:hypothetical protein